VNPLEDDAFSLRLAEDTSSFSGFELTPAIDIRCEEL
jgi:hypothetical protein